jgi:hypothetical protein
VDDFFQQRIKLFAVRAVVIGKRDDRQFWLFRAGARAVRIVKQQLGQLVITVRLFLPGRRS